MTDLVRVEAETLCLECGAPPTHPSAEMWVRTSEGVFCGECATLLEMDDLTLFEEWETGTAEPAA